MGMTPVSPTPRIAAIAVEQDDGSIMTVTGYLVSYDFTFNAPLYPQIDATLHGPIQPIDSVCVISFMPTKRKRTKRKARR